MEYIKFDENQNVLHFGRCSITSYALIKQLIVQPMNKDFKQFSCSFNQQIFQQKNIISVLFTANAKTIDFILIFTNETNCVKVFEHISKYKIPSKIEQSQNCNDFSQHILFPLIKGISLNELLNVQIRSIANNILKLLTAVEMPLSEVTNTNKNCRRNVKNNLNKNRTLKRKWKQQKQPQTSTIYFKDNIARNFAVKNFTKNGVLKDRLIVFVDFERTECFEYHWLTTNKYYVCSGCDTNKPRRTVTARIAEDGKEKFVKLSETSHVCKPRKFDPEKFQSDLILVKPAYEKLEYFEKGITKNRILIFPSPENRDQCYEFREDAKTKSFYCTKCLRKKNRIMAKICINENGEEYLSVGNKKHICDVMEYQPKIYDSLTIVKKPYFDLVKRRVNGKIAEKVVIFDEKDPTMCYEYKKGSDNYCVCYNCYLKEKNYCVSAKLIKDEKNGDFLELKQKPHICGLRKFVQEELDLNIIYSDGFKTEEYRAPDGGIKQRLIVFDQQDQNLCHIYQSIRNRGRDYWLCLGCKNLKSSKSVKFNQSDPQKPYVELSVKPHVCQLQPYIPSKIEPYKPPKIIKSPDFVIENYLFSGGKEGKRLSIFTSSEQTFCYTYNFLKRNGYFICLPCGGTTAYVIAKLLKNEKNEEYIKLNDREHTCQPQPYIPAENRDSIQIIKKPNFAFRSDPDDGNSKILIIFDPSNKELCYKYTYWPASKYFTCKKCRTLNKKLSAKLIKDEEGEDCIQLNSDQHLCELQPVDPKTEPKLPLVERKKLWATTSMLRRNHNRDLNYAKLSDHENGENRTEQLQIFHDPDYKVKNYHENGIKKSRLWVFPMQDKTKCYEYFWSNYYELFICCACEAMKPKNHATAIILKDAKNQSEYLEVGRNLHKCKIRNFDSKSFEEKYQDPKIVKKPEWKLVKQKTGKTVTDQLVIFHESNNNGQNLCYIYSLKTNSKSIYYCRNCDKKKKGYFLTAKIVKNAIEGDYVELGGHHQQHVCKPQKCLPDFSQ